MNAIPKVSCEACVLDAWSDLCRYIASGHAAEFAGQKKETSVLKRVRTLIEAKDPNRTFWLIGPDSPETFKSWSIDLGSVNPPERLAAEGKYKLVSDGAVTDNRKEAFFDLFKLEKYVASGKYSSGLFLWLTNEARYLRPTTGASSDFSTHDGRTYQSGTLLNAARARSKSMPLPLVLRGNYVLNWRQVLPGSEWYS